MIATILPSSTDFHAVAYNERKVASGSAELLEMKNFGTVGMFGSYKPSELQDYLNAYTGRRDSRIKKAQFHVAISCKGHEYTDAQLVDIAHQYLKEMGYAEPGQPLLIYAHHDTDNNHIHIITSRVAPDGHKIDHNHEKRRSLQVINKIMGVDMKAETCKIVSEALEYKFSTIAQFKAILESSGYDCKEQDGQLEIFKGGTKQDTIALSLIESHLQKDYANNSRRKVHLRHILEEFQQMAGNKEQLQALLRAKYGIALVFVGKADSPYGYMLVDHHYKEVYKGGDILPLRKLLQFKSSEDRFKDMETFIKKLLEKDPLITTRQLNRILRRQFHTRICKGGIINWNGQSFTIPDELMTTLKNNTRFVWLQSFHPSSAEEIEILGRYAKECDTSKLRQEDPSRKEPNETVEHVQRLMSSSSENRLFDAMHHDGLVAYRINDRYYCVDFRRHTIVCLDDYGIKLRQDTKKQQPLQISQPHGNTIKKVISKQGGSRDENRENEVGTHEGYEDSITNSSKLSL